MPVAEYYCRKLAKYLLDKQLTETLHSFFVELIHIYEIIFNLSYIVHTVIVFLLTILVYTKLEFGG